ncbi:MAG TPA: DUF4239 domain-containing protein [Rubrobacteraceae bacterium]|nr:DUF4239 domain-containing protein [Rubrobacteraceae bacterium]
MATILWGALVILVTVGVTVAGMILARRRVPLPLREAHNNTTATIFGALYVMYALMVGFSAYFVAYQFDTAQKNVESEAGSVEEIYYLAEQFPEPDRRKVQGLTESYAKTVIQQGWPMMKQGKLSPRAGETADELRRTVLSFEPKTSSQQAVYAQALLVLQDLDEYRALRLLDARTGIPLILWVVLVVGGILTVAFTYLFGMKDHRLHLLMVVAFTVVLILTLYTIRALEYPFDGIVQIGSDAFETVLDNIRAGGGQ